MLNSTTIILLLILIVLKTLADIVDRIIFTADPDSKRFKAIEIKKSWIGHNVFIISMYIVSITIDLISIAIILWLAYLGVHHLITETTLFK